MKLKFVAALLAGSAVSLSAPAWAQAAPAQETPEPTTPDPSDDAADAAIANAQAVDDAQAKIELLQQQVEALQASIDQIKAQTMKDDKPTFASSKASWAETTRITGKAFLNISNINQTSRNLAGLQTDNAQNGTQAELKRFYIGVDHEFSPIFSGNITTDIRYNANGTTKDVLVKALTEAGFKPVPIATTEAKYTTERDDITNDVNFRSAGWGSDWPSGSSWIPPLLGTNKSKTSAGTNYEVFSEADVDAKIKEVQAMSVDKQAEGWGNLEKEILTKYLPIIPRFYSGVAMMHGSKIQGFENDSNNGVPTWKNIWVSGS